MGGDAVAAEFIFDAVAAGFHFMGAPQNPHPMNFLWLFCREMETIQLWGYPHGYGPPPAKIGIRGEVSLRLTRLLRLGGLVRDLRR